MISTVIRELPAFIRFDGCTFQLVITIEQSCKVVSTLKDQSATLAYVVTNVPASSKHSYFFEQGKWDHRAVAGSTPKCLCIIVGIKSEMQLRSAIQHFKKFLQQYETKY